MITTWVGLGEAWSEAEARIPRGGRFEGVRRSGLGMKDQWVASYATNEWFNFYGDTPIEALNALITSTAPPKTKPYVIPPTTSVFIKERPPTVSALLLIFIPALLVIWALLTRGTQ